MTNTFLAGIVVLICGIPSSMHCLAADTRTDTGPAMACNLKALNHDERQRHATLSKAIFSAVPERRELRDGYKYRVDNIPLAGLGEWIGYEHKCCPFFRFRLELDETGAAWLGLSGGPGVKQFIEAEFPH